MWRPVKVVKVMGVSRNALPSRWETRDHGADFNVPHNPFFARPVHEGLVECN